MAELEIEGKSVEDAIQEGLKRLGCSRDKVEIKILNEGTAGLFGLMGSKPARVLLTTAGDVPVISADVDLVKAQAKVKEIVAELLRLMGVSCTEVTTALIAGRILTEIKSTENSLIIGKNGQTLDALETVVNLMLSREPETRVKVTLDTEQYRQKQEERLQDMARKAADQVRSSGKAYRFDPMSSKDRKVIHLALKTDPDVETFSEGDGPFRKVGVKPRGQ